MYADCIANRNQFLNKKFSFNEMNVIIKNLKNGKGEGLLYFLEVQVIKGGLKDPLDVDSYRKFPWCQ